MFSVHFCIIQSYYIQYMVGNRIKSKVGFQQLVFFRWLWHKGKSVLPNVDALLGWKVHGVTFLDFKRLITKTTNGNYQMDNTINTDNCTSEYLQEFRYVAEGAVTPHLVRAVRVESH